MDTYMNTALMTYGLTLLDEPASKIVLYPVRLGNGLVTFYNRGHLRISNDQFRAGRLSWSDLYRRGHFRFVSGSRPYVISSIYHADELLITTERKWAFRLVDVTAVPTKGSTHCLVYQTVEWLRKDS